jgi:hypothetical protein
VIAHNHSRPAPRCSLARAANRLGGGASRGRQTLSVLVAKLSGSKLKKKQAVKTRGNWGCWEGTIAYTWLHTWQWSPLKLTTETCKLQWRDKLYSIGRPLTAIDSCGGSGRGFASICPLVHQLRQRTQSFNGTISSPRNDDRACPAFMLLSVCPKPQNSRSMNRSQLLATA